MIQLQIKNEFLKVTKNKVLWVFSFFYLIFAIFSAYVYDDMVSQGILELVNGDHFLLAFSTDIINKPNLPIFIILMNLILIEAFIGDYERGTMKFELLAVSDRRQYFLGKLSYACLAYLLMASIFLGIGLLCAMIFFDRLTSSGLLRSILLHYLNVLPGLAVLTLLVFLAALIKRSGPIRMLALVLPIAFNFIQPISPLIDSQLVFNIIDQSNFNGLASSLLLPFVYLVIFSYLALRSWQRLDYE